MTKPIEVVLVHGAWSDGSYWRGVLRRLAAASIRASAAQVCVQGFETDVTALRRHLDARSDADVILVGHSYGGALISEVAGDNPQVTGLVYIAGVAPIAGVPFGVWMAQYPSPYPVAPTSGSGALLWMNPDDYINALAHDLPEEDGLLLWALQKPVSAASFGDSTSVEGWRTKPCWYLVTEQDHVILPEGQRSLARQMNAITRSVASGHMVAVSQPEAVSKLIHEAIESVQLREPLGTTDQTSPTWE